MEVILLQKIANLGNIGDRVKVKPGYGRNYLLPGGKATLATADNIAKFESRRAELEAQAVKELASAQQRAAALEGFKLTISAKAGSEGRLFGSVTTADIVAAVEAQTGIKLDRKSIHLDEQIKSTGEHTATASLHHAVSFPIRVEVVPT